ncbi:MAG: hypothetical protein ACLQAT_26600 [Candidatus Binataceae bacterium]
MIDTARAGGFRRPAFFLMLAAMMAIAASCYSTSYRREMAANVDLIANLADKLADYCQARFVVDGRPVSSEEMGEFYYALKKARGFSTMRHDKSDRASYRDFEVMLDQYAAFVHSADEYRIGGHADSEKLAVLIQQRDPVEQTASRVRADLASEGK